MFGYKISHPSVGSLAPSHNNILQTISPLYCCLNCLCVFGLLQSKKVKSTCKTIYRLALRYCSDLLPHFVHVIAHVCEGCMRQWHCTQRQVYRREKEKEEEEASAKKQKVIAPSKRLTDVLFSFSRLDAKTDLEDTCRHDFNGGLSLFLPLPLFATCLTNYIWPT